MESRGGGAVPVAVCEVEVEVEVVVAHCRRSLNLIDYCLVIEKKE